jgi:phosphoglycolate phosphatase
MDMNAKKLIVTFPGMGYTNDKPLMYYAIKLAMSKDFDAYCMEYHDLPTKVRGDAAKMKEAAEIAYGQVCERLEGFDFTGFDKIIFVGKSIGTVLAARYATEHNIHVKQVWYTPVEATFKFGVKRAMAFIGDADPWSDYSEVVRLAAEAGIPLHTFPGCNHSLECGDVGKDLATLREVMTLTEEFL